MNGANVSCWLFQTEQQKTDGDLGNGMWLEMREAQMFTTAQLWALWRTGRAHPNKLSYSPLTERHLHQTMSKSWLGVWFPTTQNTPLPFVPEQRFVFAGVVSGGFNLVSCWYGLPTLPTCLEVCVIKTSRQSTQIINCISDNWTE